MLPFQSTHPLRGATSASSRDRNTVFPFQSTHPLRGATQDTTPAIGRSTISIHAPLAGCDAILRISASKPADFNPRTPCGVRRKVANYFGVTVEISIHAPLAGCDSEIVSVQPTAFNFNPRTPCGVRLVTFCPIAPSLLFQSTHPLRGATVPESTSGSASLFQSTHPLRGATAKLPKYSRKICAKATKFLQSQTKSGVAACWAKGKQPLFPALRGANLPGKTGTLPVRIR